MVPPLSAGEAPGLCHAICGHRHPARHAPCRASCNLIASRETIASMKKLPLTLGIIVLLVAVLVIGGCGSYNRLNSLKQQTDKSWADVQNVYQRRADLIPNLVKTVEGAANFERTTLTEVVKARQQVTKIQLDPSKAPDDPETLK